MEGSGKSWEHEEREDHEALRIKMFGSASCLRDYGGLGDIWNKCQASREVKGGRENP